MPLLFDTRTREIFEVLNQIQRVFRYHLFQRDKDIYEVRVESIDNDKEIMTYICVYLEPASRSHIVISQDQLGMLDADLDNALVLEHWSDGELVHGESCRHASNDRNFAFLLYTCQHWVMINKRRKKNFDKKYQMKTMRRKLEQYFKTWIK